MKSSLNFLVIVANFHLTFVLGNSNNSRLDSTEEIVLPDAVIEVINRAFVNKQMTVNLIKSTKGSISFLT